ncbi:4'-phosphopantetheinyl transferase family protein [Blattabacterium cuenoti]|uniref:4'-phosphopantetheinyl transferase family protein n=1 Tax=Blattabacterium cuenoti TaxID=1653831 RepID=UPI00163C369B|nr:4'-phosphopantetheinyl transferase superfamily protein [Blattabacterium cuenoti]
MKNLEFNKIHTKIIVLKWKKLLDNFFFEKIELTNKEKKFFFSLSSKKKKKEFLGVRYALKYLGIKVNVFYDKKKKIFLYKKKKNIISLSHSYDKMAIAISYHHIGIDIEKFRYDNKILKIKNKFIRNDENIFIQKKLNNEIDYLYIIWGIKESLYKLTGGIFYNFLKNYKVSPFCIQKNFPISCWILKNSCSIKFSAFYRKIGDYYLVYSIDI